jgi:hypothetical protein
VTEAVSFSAPGNGSAAHLEVAGTAADASVVDGDAASPVVADAPEAESAVD